MRKKSQTQDYSPAAEYSPARWLIAFIALTVLSVVGTVGWTLFESRGLQIQQMDSTIREYAFNLNRSIGSEFYKTGTIPDAKALSALLSSVDVKSHGYVAVYDEKELTLHATSSMTAPQLAPVQVKALTALSPYGFLRNANSDSVLAFIKIDSQPLYLVIGADQEAWLDGWNSIAIRSLVLMIVVVIVIMLLATFVIIHIKHIIVAAGANGEFFKAVFNQAPMGMEIVSIKGQMLYANKAFCELVGFENLEGMGLREITHIEDQRKDKTILDFALAHPGRSTFTEKRYLHKNGNDVYVQRAIRLAKFRDGVTPVIVSQIEDITQRKRLQKESEDLAYYDTLTGLPNRRLMMDRLLMTCKQSDRNKLPFALMFIDLDGFKKVNDTLGHDIGDELLKISATRLTSCVRDEDTVVRQGGDEFVIILLGVADQDSAARVAKTIVEKMRLPIQINNNPIQISASIGIAIYPPNSQVSLDVLLKMADTAMYSTKQAGRNGFRFYESSETELVSH